LNNGKNIKTKPSMTLLKLIEELEVKQTPLVLNKLDSSKMKN